MDSINITTAKEYDISMQIDDVKVVNLDDYYTKAESDEKFQPVGEYLTAIPEEYVTEGELNSKGYITSIPEEYITEGELDSKGYLTEHQPLKTINGESLVGPGDITIEGGGGSVDLTNYYTKDESNERFQPVGEYLTSIPEEYVTEGELNSKGYLTEHQPLKTINGESLVGPGNITIEGGGSADLTNYYNRSEVDNLVNERARIVSLTQAEYDALEIKDENTIYNITDAEPVCYTKAESDERFLTEHQPLKTINGESLVGPGNITIEGSGGSAPGNVVTTDTTQTITGQKEFAGSVIFDGGAEFHNEIRMNNGATGDVDIAMGIACAFKVKPAQISKFYTYNIFPGNYGESDGKVHFRDFNDTADYAVIDSTGISELGTPLSDKYQAILVSGTNIKTINGTSILGSGDITITGGGGSADLTNYYTKSEIDSMIGNISTLLAEI